MRMVVALLAAALAIAADKPPATGPLELSLKRAVEIDAGVAIVPQGTVVQEVAKQTLAQVGLEDGSFHRPLAAIYKKNKVLSPAMKEFLTVLKQDLAV